MTGAEVIAAKAQAFAKDPDFRQEVSDFTSTEAPDAITVRFTKAWTTKGATRRVSGSLALKRTDGHFLVMAETNVAASDAQTKGSWSCGKSKLRQAWSRPDHARWRQARVFRLDRGGHQGAGTRKVELSDVLQPVDLGGLASWSCMVSAAQGHLAKGPLEESSTFYIEDRQLYCSQLGGGSAKLISDVECSPRGSDTDSDFVDLGTGNRVKLTCTMLPAQ